MHGFGVEDVEISPRELAALWPLARTDDVLSPLRRRRGRADPVSVATLLAKGARQLGIRVVEGWAVTPASSGSTFKKRAIPRPTASLVQQIHSLAPAWTGRGPPC
jgi:hypothetical protein